MIKYAVAGFVHMAAAFAGILVGHFLLKSAEVGKCLEYGIRLCIGEY